MNDNLEDFRYGLAKLINISNLENRSNTPDYILADYLIGCLLSYEKTVEANNKWHGRNPKEPTIEGTGDFVW